MPASDITPEQAFFSFIELFYLLCFCNRWFKGYSLVYSVIVGLLRRNITILSARGIVYINCIYNRIKIHICNFKNIIIIKTDIKNIQQI